MGQKTHPTGIRIGVNKTHDSTWFANYGAYSEVLKEDYKIRAFFEKSFESISDETWLSENFLIWFDNPNNAENWTNKEIKSETKENYCLFS